MLIQGHSEVTLLIYKFKALKASVCPFSTYTRIMSIYHTNDSGINFKWLAKIQNKYIDTLRCADIDTSVLL